MISVESRIPVMKLPASFVLGRFRVDLIELVLMSVRVTVDMYTKSFSDLNEIRYVSGGQ